MSLRLCRTLARPHCLQIRRFCDEAIRKNGQLCYVSGFSNYASRSDLLNTLGHIKPLMIDPILDSRHQFMGKWALEVNDTEEMESLRTHLLKTNQQINIFPLSDLEYSRLKTASKFGISDRSVRMSNIHIHATENDIIYFFRDFSISMDGVIKLPFRDDVNNNIFLVHFKSRHDAERAVHEKLLQKLLGVSARIFWYNC